LIGRLRRRAIVVRAAKFEFIPHINRVINEHNKLHCIWVIDRRKTLANIPFAEDWLNIPISCFIGGLGSIKNVMNKLSILRKLSIRVFLSPREGRNFRDLMILSSLGVNCGVFWGNGGNKEIDWELMNDLMHYAVYSRAKHAAIEPFDYVVSKYDPKRPTDFNSVYFDNPRRYLHLDKEENIALTQEDLMRGNFISKGISSIDSIGGNQKYIESKTLWQEYFFKMEECASCPAWRICLGKFSASLKQNSKCKDFFSDLLDAADFYRSSKAKEKVLCQL